MPLNSQENICAGDSFLIKLQVRELTATLLKKSQVPYSIEHLWWLLQTIATFLQQHIFYH